MIYLLAAAITTLYVLFVVILLWYWYKIPISEENLNRSVFISVLVPVRNESKNIEKLIHSVQNGTFQSDQFEIIVVNDHSKDETVAIVKTLCKQYDNLFIANLSKDQKGKKAAITCGVSLAKGDLIVCTDGDGEVHPDWLNSHKQVYQSGAKLSFGPVELNNPKKTRLTDILNLELAALVSMGGATLQAGWPSMINGCNYSFSKQVFEEVKGFVGNENVATGDDEFLLRKVHNKYPKNIQFLKTQNALVKSEAPHTFSEFYNQRRRWASKWRFHKDGFSHFVPAFLFLSYLIWSVLIIQSIADRSYFGAVLLTSKCLIDYCYITLASKLQARQVSLLNFGLLQIIYPIYVVFFGVASNFGKYSWRERAYKI